MDPFNLLTNTPNTHGEHDVDAVINRMVNTHNNYHEVYSNPPGGSWSQLDIINPVTNTKYRWPHLPRVSEAKRPDAIIQENRDDTIHLFLIESKQSKNQCEPRIGTKMKQYFTSNSAEKGILYKPSWYRCPPNADWMFIPPTSPDTERYWFRDYDDSKIKIWSGFAYTPRIEYYQNITQEVLSNIKTDLENLITSHNDLDFSIVIYWETELHMPRVVLAHSDDFKSSEVGNSIEDLFSSLIASSPAATPTSTQSTLSDF